MRILHSISNRRLGIRRGRGLSTTAALVLIGVIALAGGLAIGPASFRETPRTQSSPGAVPGGSPAQVAREPGVPVPGTPAQAAPSQNAAASQGPAPGGWFDNVTSVIWRDQNFNEIGVTSGINVSQGQTFTTTLALHCPEYPLQCGSLEKVAFTSVLGMGAWPAGIAPCGPFRVPFNVTGSNLPLSLSANGSAGISLTMLAPYVSYFDATHSFPHLDYQGPVVVTLYIVPM
ncbi:MAG TPA: hypothetical protein VGV64_00140 [Thermoplasmata archaeon]|nr:hypothetical protein [Thermoplasmata archaeon]